MVAANGVTGTHQFTVGVVRGDDRLEGAGRPIDLQVVTIVITSPSNDPT